MFGSPSCERKKSTVISGQPGFSFPPCSDDRVSTSAVTALVCAPKAEMDRGQKKNGLLAAARWNQ